MIRELGSSHDPLVPGVLDLAHRLFPPATLEPDDSLLDEIVGKHPLGVRELAPAFEPRACLQNLYNVENVPKRFRYLVWDEDGVRGFCRAARLSLGTLIVHLGVDPAWQGRGIGSRLLEAVRDANGELPIFAEVEEGAAMAWWRARGARVAEPRYVQPSLRPETEPVSLALMALGPVENVKAVVAAIYGEFYGIDEPYLAPRTLRRRA